MEVIANESTLEIAGIEFLVRRPHCFGIVLIGVADPSNSIGKDYLNSFLLLKENRDSFFELIDSERLVVCKNIPEESPSYRKVRGRSSSGRLSQAEYYHHDGCSSPVKPRFNEIRLPYKSMDRNVATAIAPFEDVVTAQLNALPERLLKDPSVDRLQLEFLNPATRPPVDQWDRIQGQITRVVRREMDAESAREYFRKVDELAGAYDLPWEVGESRLMLNHHSDLKKTTQHRRAFQKPKSINEANGSLVKRWTAEDIDI